MQCLSFEQFVHSFMQLQWPLSLPAEGDIGAWQELNCHPTRFSGADMYHDACAAA